MTQVKSILNLEDIKVLVDSFYRKIQNDVLLGPIFNNQIKDRWPEHLEKMYRFWQTILLEEPTYSGSPFLAHLNLPIAKEHFDKWMQIFNENIDAQFVGEKADEAKWRAARMAEMFQYKLEYYRNNKNIPLK